MIDSLVHRTKYQQLADTLRERLRTHPNGNKLPSVRVLMKRFQVSQHTVMSALALLKQEDLIASRHGSGNYRSQSERSPVIAYCRPHSPGSALDHKERNLILACERRGWTLEVHRFQASQVDYFAEDIHADGFVIDPPMITFNSPLMTRIMTNNIPRVALGRDTGSIGMDYVVGDNTRAMTEIIKGLMARGHRRIALLVSEPRFIEIEEGIRVFSHICQALDIGEYVILEPPRKYGEDGSRECEVFLREYLANLPGARLPFTALISMSDCGSIPALRVMHDLGIRVPEDLSFFCMGLDERAKYAVPSISNTMAHHEERAESCIRILEKRLAGDKSPILYERGMNSPCWRESVGPAPKGKRKFQQRPTALAT